MKPTFCFTGGDPLIEIAKQVAEEFTHEAKFIFIKCYMAEALPQLRKVEGIADVVLSGPSTYRVCSKHLNIPMIPIRATFPDLIQAIQKAKKIDNRIAICLSRDDRDFNLPLLSEVMNISLLPFYCDSIEEYFIACKTSFEMGYKAIIGGSLTVSSADNFGMSAFLFYNGKDVIRTGIKSAIDLCRIEQDGIRRVSQLSAIVNNFSGGLILTDEKGRVIIDNPKAEQYLNKGPLKNKVIGQVFKNYFAQEALTKGEKAINVIEKENLVVDYIPVSSDGKTFGMICIIKEIDEIQNTEFSIRKKLHQKGFVAKYTFDSIIGHSGTISKCRQDAALFAQTNEPVLITGESGTGKELFAHSIHKSSKQGEGPFVAINCATLPSELLESELFGYTKGAFTGAHAEGKKGLIELAHKGTIFLDEITTLSYSLQAKLLRLLSEKEILKLGSDRIIPVDIRIITATNIDIEACMADHRFRQDLYFRLNIFRLHISPLRERKEDIFPIFLHFVNKIRKDIYFQVQIYQELIKSTLGRLPLHGNVRELENIAKRFCLLFDVNYGDREILELIAWCSENQKQPSEKGNISGIKSAVQDMEKDIIKEMLDKNKNKTQAAKDLNMDRSTLWRKIKKYGI